MKQSEVVELSDADLQEELERSRKSYSELKMAHTVSPLENPMQLRTARRTIARLATELTKREQQ